MEVRSVVATLPSRVLQETTGCMSGQMTRVFQQDLNAVGLWIDCLRSWEISQYCLERMRLVTVYTDFREMIVVTIFASPSGGSQWRLIFWRPFISLSNAANCKTYEWLTDSTLTTDFVSNACVMAVSG